MSEVFIVLRQHWVDTGDNSADKGLFPVACFDTLHKAVSYVKYKMKDYPDNQVFSFEKNSIEYEDPGCEFDRYEICSISVNCEYNCEEQPNLDL